MSRLISKWLPLWAILVLPAPLLAQDFTPTNERILSDPTNIPLGGQFLGDSFYLYDVAKLNIVRPAIEAVTAERATFNVLNQRLDYGVTDRFSISVTERYDWRHYAVTPSEGVAYTLDRSGFEDPSFGILYRLLEQKTSPVSLDLSASYAPDLIDARGPTQTANGNVALGGDMLGFGAAVGRETRVFTAQAYVVVTRYGQATSQNNLGNVLTTASYWQPEIGVQTQTRFTSRLSLNADLEHVFRGDENEVNTDAGPDVYNRAAVTILDLGLNYHVIPNRLVGTIAYIHDFFGQSDRTYSILTADDSMFGRSDNMVRFRLRYAFP
jgi:hypothetical protein